MSTKKLPGRIYVIREYDANDETASWLSADETTSSVDDGQVVGIYELVETKKMRVTRELK